MSNSKYQIPNHCYLYAWNFICHFLWNSNDLFRISNRLIFYLFIVLLTTDNLFNLLLNEVFVINLNKVNLLHQGENRELTRGARIPKAQINPIFARNNLLEKIFLSLFIPVKIIYLYDFLLESSRYSFGSIFIPISRFGGSSTRSWKFMTLVWWYFSNLKDWKHPRERKVQKHAS